MAGARNGRALAVLGLVLAAEFANYLWFLHGPNAAHHKVWTLSLAWPGYVLAVALLARCRLTPRHAAWVVLGAAAVLQIAALSKPPVSSDDDYRYIWDAKVQLSGVDPYRYPPAAPHLAGLREPGLFGPPAHCTHPFAGGCTSINRPRFRTIYPPVAEMGFDLVRILSFGGHGLQLPLQIAGAIGSLLIGWLLLRHALARERPAWLAAVWAWSPIAVFEYGNNAHIDWLGVLFVVLALGANTARRSVWTGVLVGAAIATKLYPGLVLPSMMRRRPWVVLGSAVGFVALVYLPHVLAVGTSVIGYLPGYLREEQYASGQRLLLLSKMFANPYDTVVGALILLLVAVWALLRGDPEEPARSAVVVMGVALLITTPVYGWYPGLLVALVAASGALEWLPVAIAGSISYATSGEHGTTIYACGLLLTLALLAGKALSVRPWHNGAASSTTDPSPSSPSIPRR